RMQNARNDQPKRHQHRSIFAEQRSAGGNTSRTPPPRGARRVWRCCQRTLEKHQCQHGARKQRCIGCGEHHAERGNWKHQCQERGTKCCILAAEVQCKPRCREVCCDGKNSGPEANACCGLTKECAS